MTQFRHKALIMHNLILVDVEDPKEYIIMGNELHRFILSSDFYPTGPTVYRLSATGKYQIGMCINDIADCEKQEGMAFYRLVEFKDCLTFRHAYEEDPIEDSRELLKLYVREKGLQPYDKSFYHILLTSYGNTITDIYYPLQRGGR